MPTKPTYKDDDGSGLTGTPLKKDFFDLIFAYIDEALVLAKDAIKLQGNDIATAAPLDGQALVWEEALKEWLPKFLSASNYGHNTLGGIQGGAVDQYFHLKAGDATGSIPFWNGNDYNFDQNFKIVDGQLNAQNLKLNSGVFSFDGLSINSDPTKFDLGAGSGALVSYDSDGKKTIKKISWDAMEGIDSTFLTSAVGTWIGIDENGNVIQQVNDFSRDQLDGILRLGRLAHFDQTTITNTFNFPLTYETDTDWAAQQIIKGTSKLKGSVVSENSTDLSIAITAGDFVRIGAGDARDKINFPSTGALTAPNMLPARNDGSGNAILGASTTQIDPNYYDDGDGNLTELTDGYFSNKYFYFFPYKNSYTLFEIYGRGQYKSRQEALNALNDSIDGSDDFYVPDDIRGGILIGVITIKKGTTNLTAAVLDRDAIFTPTDLDGKLVYPQISALTNRIIVNTINDFPKPVGGKITLADDTEYILNENIITGYNFAPAPVGNSGIRSVSGRALVYTGAGKMFQGAIAENKFFALFQGLIVSAPNGTLFDITGLGQMVHFFAVFSDFNYGGGVGAGTRMTGNFTQYNGAKLGGFTSNNAAEIAIENSGFYNWANQNMIMISLTGSSHGPINFHGNTGNPGSNIKVFYIDTAILSPIRLNANYFGDQATPFAPGSKTQTADNFYANSNPGIENSTALVNSYFTGGTSITPGSATPQKIVATWAFRTIEGFAEDTSGKWTYNKKEAAKFRIKVYTELTHTLAAASEWKVYAAINGIVIPPAFSTPIATGKTGVVNSVEVDIKIEKNQYIEVFLEKVVGGGNAIVSGGSISITKI